MDPRATQTPGKTDVLATRLGLGTAPLCNLFQAVEDPGADAVVRRAVDAGLRLFDTAPLYGYGLAERRLGRVLSTAPRDSNTVATKIGRLLVRGAEPSSSEFETAVPSSRSNRGACSQRTTVGFAPQHASCWAAGRRRPGTLSSAATRSESTGCSEVGECRA